MIYEITLLHFELNDSIVVNLQVLRKQGRTQGFVFGCTGVMTGTPVETAGLSQLIIFLSYAAKILQKLSPES